MTDFGRRTVCPECPEVVANILPKTGLTTSYHDGDDGFYQKGWEGERFTDNEDGTVTDNATGLMWPKDWTDAGLDMEFRAWADQIDHIEGLTFADHSDWRMPNAYELLSLWNSPKISTGLFDIFDNVPTEMYWVSTSTPAMLGYAITITFTWLWTNVQLKTMELMSMPVRSI